MQRSNLLNKVSIYSKCLDDYQRRFQNYIVTLKKEDLKTYVYSDKEIHEIVLNETSNVSIYHFNQLWSNGAIGFGGIATQAFCYSDSIVIVSNKFEIAFVYHNRYAYTCFIDEVFKKHLENKILPGYVDRHMLKVIE